MKMRKNGFPKTARVRTTRQGLQEGWIRTRSILNLVEEGSKEVKKTAILSILVLVLLLAIMALANGCARHQNLQRCGERHEQPGTVVESEGGMVTWYSYDLGRSGHAIVLKIVSKSTTGLISQIEKNLLTQSAGLQKNIKQQSFPGEGHLEQKTPATKQTAFPNPRAGLRISNPAS